VTLRIIPSGQPVGAEVQGVDLERPLTAAAFAQVHAALDRHGVICIRGQQHVPPARFLAFSGRFGAHEQHLFTQFLHPGHPEILILSNIEEDGRPIGLADAGRNWHVDGSFNAKPHLYSLLHAQEIPRREDGSPLGDTLFASTVYAFATLDAPTRELLRGLDALHSLARQYARRREQARVGPHQQATTGQMGTARDVWHPAVLRHPRTDAECLYVNGNTTFGLRGMPEQEASALIDRLVAHITRPGLVYRHRWQPGDILVWDNFQVQHRAEIDYAPSQRRRMHRTTVTGW
jgi:taurine dioxygenase